MALEIADCGYQVTPDVSYGYSPTDQRLTMRDGTGTTSYAYWPNGQVQTISNGGGRKVSYAYDGVGNLTSLTYPTVANVVTRTYDELNRLSTVKD